MNVGKLAFKITSNRGSKADLAAVMQTIKEKVVALDLEHLVCDYPQFPEHVYMPCNCGVAVTQSMTPYYRALCLKCPEQFTLDEQLEQEMQDKNTAQLDTISKAQEAAEKDSGGESRTSTRS